MSSVFYQVSTLNALMLGNFDGVVTVGELLSHGSWGIGTYEGLDGEAIICDGVAYDGHADGEVMPYGNDEKVAFSTVANFNEKATEFGIADASDMAAVKAALDEVRAGTDGNDNYWWLVAMKGTFPTMKWRSCFKQQKPYTMLSEAATDQREFVSRDEEGWVIGVWCPSFVDGINMPGWHLHFLSEDKKRGGHILEMSIGDVSGTLESYRELALIMPDNPEFADLDLTEDLAEATAKVDGGK